MKSLSVLFVALTLSSSAFADCKNLKLAGEYTEGLDNRITELQNAGSHDELTWIFRQDQLVKQVDRFDSLGIYFQEQDFYHTSFNAESCVLTAIGSLTLENTYREFETPTGGYTSDETRLDVTRYYQIKNTQADSIVVGECLDSRCLGVSSVHILKKN